MPRQAVTLMWKPKPLMSSQTEARRAAIARLSDRDRLVYSELVNCIDSEGWFDRDEAGLKSGTMIVLGKPILESIERLEAVSLTIRHGDFGEVAGYVDMTPMRGQRPVSERRLTFEGKSAKEAEERPNAGDISGGKRPRREGRNGGRKRRVSSPMEGQIGDDMGPERPPKRGRNGDANGDVSGTQTVPNRVLSLPPTPPISLRPLRGLSERENQESPDAGQKRPPSGAVEAAPSATAEPRNGHPVAALPHVALGGAPAAHKHRLEEPQPVAEPGPNAEPHDPVPPEDPEPDPPRVVYVNPGHAHWHCTTTAEHDAARANEGKGWLLMLRDMHPTKLCKRCKEPLRPAAAPPPTVRESWSENGTFTAEELSVRDGFVVYTPPGAES